MRTVKPYHICSRKIGLFAVSFPPFPGGVDLGSGITFDIFTHVFHGLVSFEIY